MIKRIYTAESVTSGHPDKLADLIADSILDECLKQDSESRIAVEVMLTADKVFIAGEITTKAIVDYLEIARLTIQRVGYDTEGLGIEARIHKQSGDIAQAVDKDEQGAGDQGIMYGYATNETDSYMPLPIVLAHSLIDRLEQCRKEDIIQGLKPDGKAQVSVEFVNDKFAKITSIIVSAQHNEDKDIIELQREIKGLVVAYVLSKYNIEFAEEVLINPSGRFVEGGFKADTGLTGRKIMVDSYGGIAHHGGGAFSGKDASKVDRSGAYMARYIAKNIVSASLAERCEVALSYAIGKAEPTSVDINTFYTGKVNEELIKQAVLKVFDLRPKAIIKQLGLKKPIFAKTATGGHFGRDEFAWEQTDKVQEIKNEII